MKFLMLDLETTGLEERREPDQVVGHVPIEVAARIIEPGIPPREIDRITSLITPLLGAAAAASPQAMAMHRESGLFERALDDGRDIKAVEGAILDLIAACTVDQDAKPEPVVLMGNSIHFDRRFIKRYWPLLHRRLHYRMLDITAVNLFQCLYGVEDPTGGWKKNKAHTSDADLDETTHEANLYARNLGLLKG